MIKAFGYKIVWDAENHEYRLWERRGDAYVLAALFDATAYRSRRAAKRAALLTLLAETERGRNA